MGMLFVFAAGYVLGSRGRRRELRRRRRRRSAPSAGRRSSTDSSRRPKVARGVVAARAWPTWSSSSATATTACESSRQTCSSGCGSSVGRRLSLGRSRPGRCRAARRPTPAELIAGSARTSNQARRRRSVAPRGRRHRRSARTRRRRSMSVADARAIVGVDAGRGARRACRRSRSARRRACDGARSLHCTESGADVPQPAADVGQRLPFLEPRFDLGQRGLCEAGLGHVVDDDHAAGDRAVPTGRRGAATGRSGWSCRPCARSPRACGRRPRPRRTASPSRSISG